MSFRDWIELESDPGLFTLLVYDFGVKNVEVEEVYDLSKPFERCVYGFIFLFKWTEERKSRRKAVLPEENFILDENIENDMFFAQQIIPNSCASHALLSVLLNVPNVDLGYTLKQLRDSCKGFDSESKGLAIGNFWNIAVAHNNHGRPELRWQSNSLKNVTASRSMEAFHYVSYIPYNGRLFELDGLKPHPIDHGPWSDDESWSDKAREAIQNRIQLATGGEYSHDIRYNLLAVVPEQKEEFKQKMNILQHNKKVLIDLFKRLASKETFVNDPSTVEMLKPDMFSHPFGRVHKIRRSLKDEEYPSDTCSSTLSGNESPSHPFSDSDDSSVETYRIKSVMRGEGKGHVYVYGDRSSVSSDDKTQETNSLKRKLSEDDASNSSLNYGVNEEVPTKKFSTNESDEVTLGDVSSEQHRNSKVLENVTSSNEDDIVCRPTESQNNDTFDNAKDSTDVGYNSYGVQCSDNKTKCDGNLSDKVMDDDSTKRAVDVEPTPGLGVEIIADDADIESLLDPNKLERLSLGKLVKYEDKIKFPHLQKCMQELDELFKTCQSSYKEELEKIERYKIDDCRRRHNYDPFISTFLTMLADQDQLAKLLEEQNTVIRRVANSYTKSSVLKKDAKKKKKIVLKKK